MRKLRKNIFIIIATIYVAYLIVPIIMNFSGLSISMVSIVTFSVLLLLYPKAFVNKITAFGLIYLAVLFFYYAVGKELPGFGAGENTPLMRIIMATAFIIPNLAIYDILYYLNSDKLYGYFCFMPIAFMIVSFVTFTPLIIGNNDVLRQVTYSGGEFSTNPYLPHYSLLHAYVLIMPALILAVKLIKKKTRYLFLLAAIYMSYVIVQSSIATTLVLAVVSIAFMLIYNENDTGKSMLRAVMFVGLFFVLIMVGIVDSIMNSIVDYYEGTASEGKMYMFRDMLLGNELQSGNSLDNRSNLHAISINAFYANPFFGSAPLGGHSCLLDRLGGLGLFGFIPYVVFLFSVFQETLRLFRSKSSKVAFYVVSFSVLLMLYEKGLFGQESWLLLLVLAPSILRYVENKTQDNAISKNISCIE